MKHEDWKTFKSSHPGILIEIMETFIEDLKDKSIEEYRQMLYGW